MENAVAELVIQIGACFIAALAVVALLIYADNEKLQNDTSKHDAPRREKAN